MLLTDEPRSLSGKPSLLLDSLRIIAALTVLYVHAAELSGVFYNHPDIGHIAVIVFFVLSGYVIAHTTRNHKGRLQYAVARLSRLYSVVLPAILLTGLTELIVWKLQPEVYEANTRGASLPRYLFSTFFISEIWFFSASPPINGPLWSLSYEFWYYVIFSCFFFRKNNTAKSFLLPLLACLIAGPKILVMMPIWLSGNYAYRLKLPQISDAYAWPIVFVCLLTGLLLVLYLPGIPRPLGDPPLFYASQFITDFIAGFFIGLALWIMPAKHSAVRIKEGNWIKMVRKFADLTFPIYVLHMPLLVLWRAIFFKSLYSYPEMYTALLADLIICILLGLVLEKYRYVWAVLFTRILLYGKIIFQRFTRQINFSN